MSNRLIEKAIDQTHRAKYGVSISEAVHALDVANERNAELETVRDDMRLLARDRGEKLAEHWKRIQALEAELQGAISCTNDQSDENHKLDVENERLCMKVKELEAEAFARKESDDPVYLKQLIERDDRIAELEDDYKTQRDAKEQLVERIAELEVFLNRAVNWIQHDCPWDKEEIMQQLVFTEESSNE